MKTKISGMFYERRKCYIAGMWLCFSVIIGAISLYYLPGKISGILYSLNDLFFILVLFSSLSLCLITYICYCFFTSLTVVFETDGQNLSISVYRGIKKIGEVIADRFDFSMLATYNAKTMGTRIILELSVVSKNKTFLFNEPLDNENLGVSIKTDNGLCVENYFCRTPGTLRELLDKVKSAEEQLAAKH